MIENRTVLTLLLVLFSISVQAQLFKKKYKDLREPNSKLILSDFLYTAEKLSSTKYVLKRYFPENKQIIYFATFNSDKFDVFHGAYYEKYDNGELVTSGMYENNLKSGEWVENGNMKGNYVKGKKQGQWIQTRKERTFVEWNYSADELDGIQSHFDTLGNIKYEEAYKLGELISTTEDTMVNTSKIVQIMPRFPGCEDMAGTDEEKKKCADQKMLEYVYKHIKYPNKARQQESQGSAIIQFVIDKDGSIINIKPLRGVTREIRAECIKLVKSMPKWHPGMVDGKPVKVQFNLPIKFRLK